MADLNFTFGADGTDLNREIEKSKKAIQDLGLEQIKIARGANDFEMAALKAMVSTTASVNPVKSSFSDLDDSLKKLAGTLLSIYAAKELINFAGWANNITETAKAINFTTGELISFQAAVVQAGGSSQAASRGIEMFYMKLDQARQGGLQQQYAFERLGISLEDLKNKSDKAIFDQAINGLAAMGAGAARNRIEVELFSRSFRGIPLQEIAAQIDKTRGSFDQFGPVLDSAGKAYRQLQQDITNFKIAILSIIQPIMDAFGSGAVSVRGFQIALEGILATLALIGLAKIPVMLLAIGEAFITIAKAVETATIALRAFSIAEALAVNATGIGALVNIAAKLAAALAALGLTWLGIDAIVNHANDTNKEAAKVSEDKVNKLRQEEAAGQEVYTMYAKMNAAIKEQTQAFKDNIQAQINDLKVKDSTIGLGDEAKAKMDEELHVRDEFRKKIEQLNIELKKAQAARPEDEAYYTQGTLKKAIDDLTKAQQGYVQAAGAAALEKAKNNSADQMALLLKEDQVKINKTLADIQVSIDEMTLSTDQKKIANVQKQTNEYIKLATEKRRAQLGSQATDQDLAEDKVLQQTIAGIKEKQQAVVNATKIEIDASRDWATGWNTAFNQYKSDATNAAMESKKLFDDATKGMEDAIVSFAKTGKLSFDSLLQSLAEDILRSQVKQLFAQLLSPMGNGMAGGGGGAGGGLLGGVGKLLGFADGGNIPTNGPVLVGERGPEIISGAQGMNVTPNSAMGSNVTYNINAVDAKSFQQMVAQDPSFIYAVTLRGQNMVPGGGGL
jgi:hypothetical protein